MRSHLGTYVPMYLHIPLQVPFVHAHYMSTWRYIIRKRIPELPDLFQAFGVAQGVDVRARPMAARRRAVALTTRDSRPTDFRRTADCHHRPGRPALAVSLGRPASSSARVPERARRWPLAQSATSVARGARSTSRWFAPSPPDLKARPG